LTGDANLTQTGHFVGTPLFASPEQHKGEPVDVRTDVYSVAATLYYLLTGKAPFEGGDAEIGPLVNLGSYTVELTADGKKLTTKVEVTLDPRFRVGPLDLRPFLQKETVVPSGIVVLDASLAEKLVGTIPVQSRIEKKDLDNQLELALKIREDITKLTQ